MLASISSRGTHQKGTQKGYGVPYVPDRKKSKEIKGRLAYNGKPTHDWISREDKSSPNAQTESILLPVGIDAMECRDIMTLDIPNAFIQAHVPKSPDGERIIMKI